MRVALYARVSTTRQAENELSIPDQLRQMQHWCDNNDHTVVAEYVDAGATATDDKRPEFQKMVAAAETVPLLFDIIVVHSLSRFFRDQVQGTLYQRSLLTYGVKLISITQLTNDDPSGDMSRSIFMLFDEYQSKENAKHTLRGMLENARQGFWNGSKPPFGYKTIDAGQTGSRGRIKKKLDIDPAEAEIVRKIFELYVFGDNSPRLGMKAITTRLNERGFLMRGNKWRKQKIQEILSSETYIGLHTFNKNDSKAKKLKDESEWIKVRIPAIIDMEMFEKATILRKANSPKKSVPRRETSPNLLTGLLKCGGCGAGMTIITGKGGRYRYYSCINRLSKGNSNCSTKNIPADKIEELVLNEFRKKVCDATHLRSILKSLRDEVSKNGGSDKGRIQKLSVELKKVEQAQNNLLDAVEKGILDLELVGTRAKTNKVRKEDLLLEIAGLKRKQEMPLATLSAQKINAFTRVIMDRLTASSPFSKAYLKATVSEIRVKDKEITISGEKATLVGLASNGGKLNAGEVPSFGREWRPREELNLRPQV